jgi:hypothetical protein
MMHHPVVGMAAYGLDYPAVQLVMLRLRHLCERHKHSVLVGLTFLKLRCNDIQEQMSKVQGRHATPAVRHTVTVRRNR